MKFKLLILMLFLSSVSIAQIDFFGGTHEELQSRAKSHKKNYFIDFYTDWCGYCKKMDGEAFQNLEVAKVSNSNFLAFKINAEKEGLDLAQKLGVTGYPTIAFFNYKGELIGLHPGYKSAGEFMLLLDKYKGEVNEVSISSFFDVNKIQVDQLKIKSFNEFGSDLKSHIQKASDFGALKKDFDWEEYLLDAVLSPADELHASSYFYLFSGNWSKLESNILLQIELGTLSSEELAYFICQFAENEKVTLNQLKWVNELVLLDDNSFFKELRIATLYIYGDVDDANSSYEVLKKEYKKKGIEREMSMQVLGDLMK